MSFSSLTPEPPRSPRLIARYKPFGIGRNGIRGAFILFSIFFGGISIALLGSDEPLVARVLFIFFGLFALLWNGYWYLFRISVAVTLDGSQLRWTTAMRDGIIDVDEISAIRPFFMQVVKIAGAPEQQPILVFGGKGLREFVGLISKLRPDVPVHLNGWARFAGAKFGKNRLHYIEKYT